MTTIMTMMTVRKQNHYAL